LLKAQTGRVFKGFVTDVPPGVHVLRWTSAADQVDVVWVDTPDRTLNLTLPKGAKAVQWWDGKAQDKVGSLKLTEQDGPLFVTMSR